MEDQLLKSWLTFTMLEKLPQIYIFDQDMVWNGMEDDFSIFHTGNFLPFHTKYLSLSHPIFEALFQWATRKIHSAWKYPLLNRHWDVRYALGLKAVNHPADSRGLQQLKLNYNFAYCLFRFWGCGCKDIQQIHKDIPRQKVFGNSEFCSSRQNHSSLN